MILLIGKKFRKYFVLPTFLAPSCLTFGRWYIIDLIVFLRANSIAAARVHGCLHFRGIYLKMDCCTYFLRVDYLYVFINRTFYHDYFATGINFIFHFFRYRYLLNLAKTNTGAWEKLVPEQRLFYLAYVLWIRVKQFFVELFLTCFTIKTSAWLPALSSNSALS